LISIAGAGGGGFGLVRSALVTFLALFLVFAAIPAFSPNRGGDATE
jgi:hypothetical protein